MTGMHYSVERRNSKYEHYTTCMVMKSAVMYLHLLCLLHSRVACPYTDYPNDYKYLKSVNKYSLCNQLLD